MAISKSIIEEFRDIHTGTIADVLDYIGVWGIMDYEIKPLTTLKRRIAGPAVTVRWRSIQKRPGLFQPLPTMWEMTKDWLSAVDSGSVYVAGVDGEPMRRWALSGYISCVWFEKQGLEAAIFDGGIRDISEIRKMDFPVFARTSTPQDALARAEAKITNEGIQCGGVIVSQGDLIVADEDGAVVVPQNQVEKVYKLCKEIEKREESILQKIKAGITAQEAVEQYGRI